MSCRVSVIGGMHSDAVPLIINDVRLLADMTKLNQIARQIVVLLPD